MNDNFDLRKYLIENKVTTNSKMLNEASISPEGNLEDFKFSGEPKLDSYQKSLLLDTLPDYTETYLTEKGLEDYLRGDEGDGLAALEELGFDGGDIYLSIEASERGDNNVFYDLEDGYILATEDYAYYGPKIYKKVDLDKLVQEHPELLR